MDPAIRHAFDVSEKHRENLLKLIAPASADEKYYARPSRKWSISQILAHLIQAERTSLEYMRKKVLGIENAGNTGVIEDAKFLFLIISQRLPLKYKAPKILGGAEPPAMTFPEVTNEWNTVREELRMFLEGIQSHQVRRKLYKHVVVGRLNVVHALRFFDEHLRHHLPQVKRLL
jgi:hypothetical protein